jgi:hypothetical protein
MEQKGKTGGRKEEGRRLGREGVTNEGIGPFEFES